MLLKLTRRLDRLPPPQTAEAARRAYGTLATCCRSLNNDQHDGPLFLLELQYPLH